MAPYLMTETPLYLYSKNIIDKVDYLRPVKTAFVFCNFFMLFSGINNRADKFSSGTVWTKITFDD
jgi:hypothetical protein